MACLRRNVEFLTGELLYERIGQGFVLSVFSRAWLAWCLAEVGEFGEGLTRGRKGSRLPRQPINPLAALRRIIALARYIFIGETSTRSSRC
jgi:hypothetical protein